MRRPTFHGSRLLAPLVAMVLAAPMAAHAGDGLGAEAPFQFQPELDLFKQLDDTARLILQVPATYSPSNGYSDVQANFFLSYLVAPVYDNYLSPDIAKTRRLELRAGLGYFTTTTADDPDPVQRLVLMGEVTPRGTLPAEINFAWRNRYEARWLLGANDPFSYRLRTRLQLEHDFVLPGGSGSALTPYANAEVIWSSSVEKWQQVQMLLGLVWSVKWFGRGQSLEVNGGATTTLAPTRSTAPVFGLVFSQFLD